MTTMGDIRGAYAAPQPTMSNGSHQHPVAAPVAAPAMATAGLPTVATAQHVDYNKDPFSHSRYPSDSSMAVRVYPDSSNQASSDPVRAYPSDSSPPPPAMAAAAQDDSAESQLMLLSRVAEAAVEAASVHSKKRRADDQLDATSPPKRSALGPDSSSRRHSRNPSAVSVASVASAASSKGLSNQDGSKIATVLKYAMVKVKNGWENMSMNQVEADLATRSPHASSVSSPTSDLPAKSLLRSPPVLAPPPPIEKVNPRRASDLRGYAPTLLQSTALGPHTPHPNGRGHAKKLSVADSMLFPGSGSQNRNSREQEAVQSLLFMSSPGNTAPLKRNNTFSPEAHAILPPLAPPPPLQQQQQPRQPLPDSRRERKPLPTQKPNPSHRHSLSASMAAPKRVGFPASPGFAMDVDSPTPNSKSRKKLPTSALYTHNALAPEPPRITLPAALGAHGSTPRKKLSEQDIERMIDSVMKEMHSDDDDDGPIEIPPRPRTKLPV